MKLLGLSIALLLVTQITQAGVDDVVQRARQIFLKQGRVESLQYLERAIQGAKESDQRSKWVAEGEVLAGRFFRDEAQRKYELAESFYFSKNDEARATYESALRQDKDNVGIHFSLVRLELRSGRCEAAHRVLEQVRKIWSFSRFISLYEWQLAACRKSSFENPLPPSFKSDLSVYAPYLPALVLAAKVERRLRANPPVNYEDLYQSPYPEIHYWLFKSDHRGPELGLEHLRKYVSLCQEFGASDFRRFRHDPLVCSRLEEANKFLSEKPKKEL